MSSIMLTDRMKSIDSTRANRIVFALVVGVMAAGIRGLVHVVHPAYSSDFGPAWFGGGALLRGLNPYDLIGPDRVFGGVWYMAYPATTMVLAIPLSFLAEHTATLAFVAISAALLAYGIASSGLFRWPLFLSGAFIDAALAAQWSPLLTAALCIPALSWLVAAKPNFAIPLIGYASSRRTLIIAAVGGLALTALSLAIRPTWPIEWKNSLTNWDGVLPIVHLGGFLIPLALLKWKRRDARLLIAMSLMPQTFYWYETLPLFLIPATFRESVILAFTSSAAYAMEIGLIHVKSITMTGRIVGAIIIFSTYIPCLVMILRRPNVTETRSPASV
jgi:hypothetical protein